MKDIKAPASGKYRAVHDSGPRIATNIKYVVIHSTEGDTAEGAASWFTNPRSGGSANMVVDDGESFRTLPDFVVPWAAPNLNTSGWHLELAGHAKWTRDDWLSHKLTLKRAAYKAALRCHLYKIPVRWVGPLGLRVGRSGLTTHRAASFAWPLVAKKVGFHTDPGTGFPRDIFLSYVKQYVAELSV